MALRPHAPPICSGNFAVPLAESASGVCQSTMSAEPPESQTLAFASLPGPLGVIPPHAPAATQEVGDKLLDAAKSLFAARVVRVIPRGQNLTGLEERCFEMLFPDRGCAPPVVLPPAVKAGLNRDEEGAMPAQPAPAAVVTTTVPKATNQPHQKTFEFTCR
jgi:hypothetical protein